MLYLLRALTFYIKGKFFGFPIQEQDVPGYLRVGVEIPTVFS